MPDEETRLRAVFRGYAGSRRRAKAWSAANSGNRAIRAEVADAITSRAPSLILGSARILDIGCGTGWWLEELVRAGVDASRLTGVELLEERVAAAARRVPAAEVVHGDAAMLPFASGSFEVVTLLTVLSSMPTAETQRQALGEAVRVLAPSGHLFVWEPRVANPFNRDTRLVRRSLLTQCDGADAEVSSVTLMPWLARRLGHLSALYRAFARAPFLRSHRLVHLRRPAGQR